MKGFFEYNPHPLMRGMNEGVQYVGDDRGLVDAQRQMDSRCPYIEAQRKAEAIQHKRYLEKMESLSRLARIPKY